MGLVFGLATAISQDGRYVAYAKDEGGKQSLWLRQMAICRRHANRAVNEDGKAINYVNTTGTVSNLSLHPIKGGAPKPLTDFKENQITAFAWSPDAKQLALSRGVRTKDVVVLR